MVGLLTSDVMMDVRRPGRNPLVTWLCFEGADKAAETLVLLVQAITMRCISCLPSRARGGRTATDKGRISPFRNSRVIRSIARGGAFCANPLLGVTMPSRRKMDSNGFIILHL